MADNPPEVHQMISVPMDTTSSGESARDRLSRLGASALTDAELLALLLRPRGGPFAAERLLASGGGLKALATRHPLALRKLPGLGATRTTTLLAAVELGRRAMRGTDTRPVLTSADAAYRHLAPSLQALRREVFHVLCLNTRNVLLLDSRVAEGSVSICPVDPREVFSAALTSGAAALILAHNHPSGDPEPSLDDIDLTKHLAEGAQLLGLQLLDHIIIGDARFVSLRERGLVPKVQGRKSPAIPR